VEERDCENSLNRDLSCRHFGIFRLAFRRSASSGSLRKTEEEGVARGAEAPLFHSSTSLGKRTGRSPVPQTLLRRRGRLRSTILYHEIRLIRVHHRYGFSFWAETRKATLISQRGLYNLMRRRPTLPYTFAHSTIGPAGLNFRVRDGNGWNPRGKITANRAFSTQPSALSRTREWNALNLAMREHQSGSTVFSRARGLSLGKAKACQRT
jgi:hypothetical protein